MRWHTVLCHDRRDVGVVVLDFGHRAPRCLLRPALRLIAGVGIGGQLGCLDTVEAGKLAGGALEGPPGLEAAHVADVLAHEGVIARREAERVLELPADRERGLGGERQADR